MFDDQLLMLARLTLDEAQQKRLKIVTAESCTGGLIAGLLTEIPGSSATVERGFVVYSNRAKEEMLNVPGDLIADAGAVSEPVVRAMAEGALEQSAPISPSPSPALLAPAAGRRSSLSASSTSPSPARTSRSFIRSCAMAT